MTVFTEGFYTGEYILSEANGKRGRGKGTVAIGNELVAGAIVELTGGEYVPATNGGTDPVAISYCLLYTSPSPRDRQKSRMPSSA